MNDQKRIDSENDIPADAQWLGGDLREWANTTVSAPATDMAALRGRIEAERGAGIRPQRSWAPPRLAWNLAAAALFLFAFTQVSFTVRRGDAEWSWGSGQRSTETSGQWVNLQNSVANLAYTLNEHQVWLAALAVTDAEMKRSSEQTRAQLAAWQELESETRYADVEKLIALIQAQSGQANIRPIANLTN